MTSRPVGSQRHPPQRSLSATNIIQRPPRSFSQHFPHPSFARRSNEGFTDLTVDGSDAAAVARYGTLPRNGGSRLKLEITEDSKNAGFVDTPKPTPDPTTAWKPSIPPRGRPQLHFDVPSVSNLTTRTAQEGGQSQSPERPMPLPVRPVPHPPPAREIARAVPGSSAKKDTRPKPYVLEVPAAAPRYPPNGHADFYPWTGNHQEDVFSDNAIRNGFFDKAQMTQNETGSAKATIFPSLKHKSSLQTLSSLFTGILAQRMAHGKITSPSTFKPPPRVTVTDTKREMWLKDLANPTIPLRRLSRSIPHGIRGKVLLDQSISKNIPIERATWLAKCVGANELRSFRRKGGSGTFAMGGEAKWVRDFTVGVEQFVESVVASCGDKDFKNRVTYAVRLAAHFHTECLLDRDHYLDWLVSSLENSSLAKLPMWLLICQAYFGDILRYRKYGRRLGAALLNQMDETLKHPDNDILAPVYDRLQTLVKLLIISNPETFISPKTWSKHRRVISSSLTATDPGLVAKFKLLDRRNDRFTTPGTAKELPPRQRFIQILDGYFSKPFSYIPQQCWNAPGDRSVLMQALLEWSTSSHRPGLAKIYIAARSLRFFSRSGVDVNAAILRFLESEACESGRNKSAFYHLVSELARSEHFSAAKYLQWLIARGGIYEGRDIEADGPCSVRLLVELPTSNLSEGILALRETMLRRAEFSVVGEEEHTRACMVLMNKSLPGMQANVITEPHCDLTVRGDLGYYSSALSRSSKAQIGLWLRQMVKLQMLQPTIPPLDDWDDSPMKGGTSAIAASDFNTIRQYLELIEDYSMLADVLKIVTSSSDPEVLASCADTLNLHIPTFLAIGALKPIFVILAKRLSFLMDEADAFPRVFLVSLSDLAARVPDYKPFAKQLAQQLARSDRNSAANACSPVSDHMAGVVQTAEADFTDEIEKVLASGNSMDKATLQRLFRRIALRSEASWKESPDQNRSCGLLFTRLRTFDPQQFDILMAAWMNRFLQMSSRPSMIQVFGPLIGFGCLALKDAIVNGGSVLEKLTASDAAAGRISLELLALVTASSNLPEIMTVEEAYRFRIKQTHMQVDRPVEILTVLRRALENTQPAEFGSADLLASHGTYELLQRLVLVDRDLATKALVLPLLQNPSVETSASITSILDKLLAPGRVEEETHTIPFEVVLNLADDFTIPFCQMKLGSMFSNDDINTTGTGDSGSESLQAFDNAIESAVAAQNTTWTCIVPLLDISIAQHLRQRAERQFLASFPSPKWTDADGALQNNTKQAESLLYIITATAYSISSPPTINNLAAEIVTTLNNIWLLVHGIQVQDVKEQILTEWLPLILSFTTMYASAFEATKAGHENKAKALVTLTAILLELESLSSTKTTITTLSERTFDLALHLIDSLPDDMRQNCIRELREATSIPMVLYLFSVWPSPTSWLMLSQREKIPVAPGSNPAEGRAMGAVVEKEKLTHFPLKRWEMLGEPTPNVGENDTSLSLTLFGARKV